MGPNGQYRTIQAALDANDSSETDRLVLKITPGDYREKITVTKPGVTFANADVTAKRAVTIRASYYSSNTFDADGKFVPQDEFDLGTNKCATVTIGAGATGFSAYGITFQNDYNVVDHTAAGEQTPAVALNTQADKVYLKNSRIIGRQDTLYVQGAGNRVYVDGGYIEGTVDFVFGDANAYFAGTELHMAAFAGKNNGYFTAANTKKSGVGLVFDRCNLTVAAAYDDDAKLSLGRPWQTFAQYTQVRKGDGSSYVTGVDLGTKNSAYTDTSSAVTYLDSTMSSKITKNRWNVWTSKNQSGKSVDVTFHDDVRFRNTPATMKPARCLIRLIIRTSCSARCLLWMRLRCRRSVLNCSRHWASARRLVSGLCRMARGHSLTTRTTRPALMCSRLSRAATPRLTRIRRPRPTPCRKPARPSLRWL